MFERYYRELLNFCARMVKDRDVAADVTQESYARVLALQRDQVSINEPRALLYQTARHVMVDRHRREAFRSHQPLDDLPSTESLASPASQEPDARLATSQSMRAYLATIEALPPRCREAFVLHIYDGLSHAEIARQMGTSVSMVEKHIARGRLACRACARQLRGDAAGAAASAGQ